jgi:hypothetical protein
MQTAHSPVTVFRTGPDVALRESAHSGAAQRVLVSASVHGKADEASRDGIRRLFQSPLGVYVSHASREHEHLQLEFDVAPEDVEFTIRALRQVLPEAVIDAVRPRVSGHRGH